MTEQQIAQILAETERFAEPRPVWPSVLVLGGMTFFEHFSKPLVWRLWPSYTFLPQSLVGPDRELRGWVREMLPEELMRLFDEDAPEGNLPPWLSHELFERINGNVGKAVSRMVRRRNILQMAFLPIFLLSLIAVFGLDLRCLFSIKAAIDVGEINHAIAIGALYVLSMAIVAFSLGVRHRR